MRFLPLILVISLALNICHISLAANNHNIGNEFSAADSIYLDLIGKADTAIAQQDWAGAESLLLSALRSQPSNPANILLLSNLAMIRFQQGNDSIALATINDAYAIAPKSITVLSNRARINKAMGNIDDAFLDYSKIIEIDSTNIDAWYMHGMIALSKTDIKTALHDFNNLEQIAPNDLLTFDALSTYYFYIQDFNKAIPYFKKLIALNNSADYYYDKIICLLFDDQLSEASADINDALKLYPTNGKFYLLKAYLNRIYYRNSDAEVDIKKAIELGIPKHEAKVWLEMPLPNRKQ